MFDALIPIIVALPLAGFVITALIGRRLDKQAHVVPVGVVVIAWAISMLMSIELMLNAVNLAIVAFGSFVQGLQAHGSIIALMVMAVAAAEATVGLSIVIAIFRNRNTPLVDEYDAMSR